MHFSSLTKCLVQMCHHLKKESSYKDWRPTADPYTKECQCNYLEATLIRMCTEAYSTHFMSIAKQNQMHLRSASAPSRHFALHLLKYNLASGQSHLYSSCSACSGTCKKSACIFKATSCQLGDADQLQVCLIRLASPHPPAHQQRHLHHPPWLALARPALLLPANSESQSNKV